VISENVCQVRPGYPPNGCEGSPDIPPSRTIRGRCVDCTCDRGRVVGYCPVSRTERRPTTRLPPHNGEVAPDKDRGSRNHDLVHLSVCGRELLSDGLRTYRARTPGPRGCHSGDAG